MANKKFDIDENMLCIFNKTFLKINSVLYLNPLISLPEGAYKAGDIGKNIAGFDLALSTIEGIIYLLNEVSDLFLRQASQTTQDSCRKILMSIILILQDIQGIINSELDSGEINNDRKSHLEDCLRRVTDLINCATILCARISSGYEM